MHSADPRLGGSTPGQCSVRTPLAAPLVRVSLCAALLLPLVLALLAAAAHRLLAGLETVHLLSRHYTTYIELRCSGL